MERFDVADLVGECAVGVDVWIQAETEAMGERVRERIRDREVLCGMRNSKASTSFFQLSLERALDRVQEPADLNEIRVVGELG